MIVTFDLLDGALGFTSGPPRGYVKIGTSIAGDVNKLIAWTDGQQALATHKGGPLVESTALSLANGSADGGGLVYGMRINASVAGSVSLVVSSLKPGSDGALATTGSVPVDNFEVLVKMTRAGLIGASPGPAFRYSLDGGDNYSEETAVPAGGVYDLNATYGIRLVFSSGATGFKEEDLFTFNTTGPSYNNTDLNDALTALKASPDKWEFVHVLGAASSATAAVVQSWLNAQRRDGRMPWALLEARDRNAGESEDDWMTALKTDYDAFVSPIGQISVVPGYCELTSAVSGRLYRRPLAWPVATRAASVPFQRDLGRVKDGPLPGLAKNTAGTIIYHDERVKPGLEAARFLTVTSLIGKKGYFVGGPAKRSPSTMAEVTSDYSLLQNVRVILYAAQLVLEIGADLLGEELEVNADGTILERRANEIDADMSGKLSDFLVSPRYCVAVKAQVDRAVNLLTTKMVRIRVLIRPFGYAKEVRFELGFENPRLKAA